MKTNLISFTINGGNIANLISINNEEYLDSDNETEIMPSEIYGSNTKGEPF